MAYKEINVKTLKAKLTIEDYKAIMKALDIPIYSETATELRYWTGDKNKNALNGSAGKLVFYKDTKIYCGYTSGCGYDIISLCQKRLGLLGLPSSFFDAVTFIISVSGIDESSIQRISQKKHTYDWEADFGKFLRFKNGISELPVFDKKILDGLSKSYPLEWVEEGISVESMQKYQIGYYERCNQTTIPVFGTSGELHGIRVREWNPESAESYGKYHPLTILDGTTFKFPTNNVLYGLNYNQYNIENTGQVWICEGEKGVMKLDTFYGDKSCAVAMLGSNLGINRRNALIKHGVKDVVLVADCDFIGKDDEEFEKWKKHILKQAELWKGYANVSVVFDDGEVLGPKENATDKDFDTWLKLFEEREVLF